MNKFKTVCVLAVAAALGVLLMANISYASETVTIPVSVAVTAPAAVDATITSLDFGSIALDASGDIVTFDVSASASAQPTAQNSSVISGATPGNFIIHAYTALTPTITYPSTNTTLYTGVGDTCTLYNVGTYSTAAAAMAAGADKTYYVGGALLFAADSEAGTYSGSIDIDVAF